MDSSIGGAVGPMLAHLSRHGEAALIINIKILMYRTRRIYSINSRNIITNKETRFSIVQRPKCESKRKIPQLY